MPATARAQWLACIGCWLAFIAAPSAHAAHIRARDTSGKRVDLRQSHASLSRVLPQSLSQSVFRDADALSWLVAGPAGTLAVSLTLVTEGPGGARVDARSHVALHETTCPADLADSWICRETGPIRLSTDSVDAAHPRVTTTSLIAKVGGVLRVLDGRTELATIRAGGPRHSAVGAMRGYRTRIQAWILRSSTAGPPAIGSGDRGARLVMEAQIRSANAIWGQCGVRFEGAGDRPIRIIEPPPAFLLAIGGGVGFPASGGVIGFRIGLSTCRVATHSGESPLQGAESVAALLRRRGYRATVSPNPRARYGALRGVDVLVHTVEGAPVALVPDLDGKLTTDASLGVCLGEVDLLDGLQHFSDLDAAGGTVEERTLLKSLTPAAPGVVNIVVVPYFEKSGRIGESFVEPPGAAIRNTVIVDRAGVRAGSRSFVLAHELGHVLLEMPGHPDDFGVDRPQLLMDSDSADGTIFGPRRLPVSACERMLSQSGPRSSRALLRVEFSQRTPK